MHLFPFSAALLLLSVSAAAFTNRLARPVPHFPLQNQHAEPPQAQLLHVPLSGYPFSHHPNNPETLHGEDLLAKIKSQMKAAGLRYNLKQETKADFKGNTNKLSVDAGTSPFEFTGTVGFGTPPQYFQARFDSSSAVSLVVKGSSSYYDDYKDSTGFIADKSSTFHNFGKSVSVFNSTSQKSTYLNLYQDKITVGKGSGSHHILCASGPFAKIDRKDWTLGSHVKASLGLGPKAEGSDITPWFDNLVNQGDCAPYYALYPPIYNSDGVITKHAQATFCGLDNSRTDYVKSGKPSWIPSKPSKKGFWELGIDSFKCGDEDLLLERAVSYDSYEPAYDSYEIPYETPYETPTPYATPAPSYLPKKEYTGILDSGSIQFRFPSRILTKINEKIGAKCDSDICEVDCSKVSTLPTFELGFDLGSGKSQGYKITPKEYVLKSGKVCVSGFSGYGCEEKKKSKYRRTYEQYDDYKYDEKYDDYSYDDYEKCDEPDTEIVIGGVFFQSNIAIHYVDVEEKYVPPPPPPPPKPKPSPPKPKPSPPKPKPSPEYVPEPTPEYTPAYTPEYTPEYSPKPEYTPEYKPEYTPEYTPEYKPEYSPKDEYKPTPVYEPSPYKRPEPSPYKRPEPSVYKNPEESPYEEKKPEPSPHKNPEPLPKEEKKPIPSPWFEEKVPEVPKVRPGVRKPLGPPSHFREFTTERIQNLREAMNAERFNKWQAVHEDRLRSSGGRRVYRREEFFFPLDMYSPTGMGSALMFISAY